VPEPDDELRWLALMQHHGAPTRLTDWTFSILVAAYFAIEEAAGDSAIFQIDNRKLREISGKYLMGRGVEASLNVTRGNVSQEESKKRFSKIYLKNSFKFVRSMTPYYKDRRLIAQQGTFVCQGDVSTDFASNVSAMGDCTGLLNKYVIPYSCRHDLLERLHAANIGRFTLFPGLDGFAQSLKIFDPVVWGAPDVYSDSS